MEPQLKQRLVGIAVIFSLAVIFLPMILDGAGQKRESVEIEIPPRPGIRAEVDVERRVLEIRNEVAEMPEITPLIIDEQSLPVTPNNKAARSPQESTVAARSSPTPLSAASPEALSPSPGPAAKPAPKVKSEPKLESRPLVGGASWVIQVGSFSERDRAFKQRDRLRKSKLAAVFIEEFERTQGGTGYRVRMGPFLDRDSANVVRNKVMAKYDVRGLVMKYEH
jgi:DedD protein